jgi:hypothetical protein
MKDAPQRRGKEKPMDIYLSARFDRRAEIANYAPILLRHGFGIASSWLWDPQEPTWDGAVRAAAEVDLNELDHADVLIAFTEAPNPIGGNTGGRHVELGYALAKGKRIIVVGPRENVFHHLPGIYCCESLSAAIGLLQDWAFPLRPIDVGHAACSVGDEAEERA